MPFLKSRDKRYIKNISLIDNYQGKKTRAFAKSFPTVTVVNADNADENSEIVILMSCEAKAMLFVDARTYDLHETSLLSTGMIHYQKHVLKMCFSISRKTRSNMYSMLGSPMPIDETQAVVASRVAFQCLAVKELYRTETRAIRSVIRTPLTIELGDYAFHKFKNSGCIYEPAQNFNNSWNSHISNLPVDLIRSFISGAGNVLVKWVTPPLDISEMKPNVEECFDLYEPTMDEFDLDEFGSYTRLKEEQYMDLCLRIAYKELTTTTKQLLDVILRNDKGYAMEIAGQALMIQKRYVPTMDMDAARIAWDIDLDKDTDEYVATLDPKVGLRVDVDDVNLALQDKISLDRLLNEL